VDPVLEERGRDGNWAWQDRCAEMVGMVLHDGR
jgi:hypothetical protein